MIIIIIIFMIIENIGQLVERGEKLEVMVQRTDKMATSAMQYRRGAKKVRTKMQMKSIVWGIILTAVVLVRNIYLFLYFVLVSPLCALTLSLSLLLIGPHSRRNGDRYYCDLFKDSRQLHSRSTVANAATDGATVDGAAHCVEGTLPYYDIGSRRKRRQQLQQQQRPHIES